MREIFKEFGFRSITSEELPKFIKPNLLFTLSECFKNVEFLQDTILITDSLAVYLNFEGTKAEFFKYEHHEKSGLQTKLFTFNFEEYTLKEQNEYSLIALLNTLKL